ncbi:MAG: hypothetical protein ABF335_03210 [Alphaproteobacteria bacterium]
MTRPISDTAAEAVRLNFNPSGESPVDELKTIAAEFITKCEAVQQDIPAAGRELALARTYVETAQMWAVKGATKR